MSAPQAPESTAVATKRESKGIRALLEHESARERIAPFLMPGADYDRVIAGAHYAARQNPAITQCTSASIIDAVCRVQQWGLEIGLTAHLVPFNTNVGSKEQPKWEKICTPIADYTGLAELMVKSGAVRHVEMRVVYEKDEFRYSYGLNSELYHVPTQNTAARGRMIAAYCVLRLPFGASSFEVMPVEDIDAIRQKYSKQWKKGDLPAWYAKKTTVRQAAKLVPKNQRMAQAMRVIQEDEAQEFDERLDTPSMRAALEAGEPESDTPATTALSAHNTGKARLISGGEYAAEDGDLPFENADDMDDLTDAEIEQMDAEARTGRSR